MRSRIRGNMIDEPCLSLYFINKHTFSSLKSYRVKVYTSYSLHRIRNHSTARREIAG